MIGRAQTYCAMPAPPRHAPSKDPVSFTSSLPLGATGTLSSPRWNSHSKGRPVASLRINKAWWPCATSSGLSGAPYDATFDQSIAINLKGTFNICREAARRVRKGGRIINVSTSLVGVCLPTYGVYIATKAAVESLTQVLAQELRGRSITVNAARRHLPRGSGRRLDQRPGHSRQRRHVLNQAFRRAAWHGRSHQKHHQS